MNFKNISILLGIGFLYCSTLGIYSCTGNSKNNTKIIEPKISVQTEIIADNEPVDTINRDQINQPELFKKVYSHFQLVPDGINIIEPKIIINLQKELNVSDIHTGDILADGTIFIAGSELVGKLFFIYLKPDGKREIITYPKKPEKTSSLSTNKDYLWFNEELEKTNAYQLKAYDIINHKIYSARQLLKNPISDIALASGFSLTFTATNETKLQIDGLQFLLPPLSKLIKLKEKNTPYDAHNDAVIMQSKKE